MNDRRPTTQSLAGRRVLVTRPPHQAQALATALAARGAEVVPCPVLAITAVTDEPAPDLSRYRWVVITSPNGVRYLADALGDGSAPWPAGTRLAVVGPGTAARAEARGWPVHLQPPDATGDALAAEFRRAGLMQDQPVLRVRGDLAPPAIEDTLRTLGAEVTVLTLYRTVPVLPPPAAVAVLEAGRADAVAFASGSAVSALLAALPHLDLAGSLVAACIGPVTAVVARQAGWRQVLVSDQPTSEGLAATLARHLGPTR